jgi:dTMP kinase
MSAGKFIVIDGTDGSGKATQTDILVKRLEAAGRTVFKISFPQYGQASAGLIAKYLNGDYGTAEAIGPYRASVFYACDRYDGSWAIRRALDEGKIVIADRYAFSNMAHQGGKIADDRERQAFFAWLDNLEFSIFQIPRPDLSLILHVASAIGQQLVDAKDKRDYLKDGQRDIHEADLHHLELAEKVYLDLARTMPKTKLIECVADGQIMSREMIAELVWEEVNKLLSP